MLRNNLLKFWNTKENRFHLFSVAIIIVLTVSVYANTLDNEFTNWDDIALILNNTHIRSLGVDNLKEIFSFTSGGTYQPMRVFSYALDYSIGQFDPFIYHLHNIFLHILASLLLYVVLLKALPQIQRGRVDKSILFLPLDNLIRVVSLFSVLLFALHPVNVEAVTWLSSRKYVLLAFFFFGSFLFYLQRPESKKLDFLFYMMSFVFWIFAVMSSPFGVVLPALFILFEYSAHPDINPFACIKDNLFRFSPYILMGILVLIYLMVKLTAFGRFVNSASTDVFVTMMQVFYDYMRNFLLPLWLNNRYVDYVYTSIFQYYKILAGFSLLLFLILASVYKIITGKNKFLFFTLFWFLIALLPASNIIPISTRMADRYVYLASIGFFVFFSWSGCYLINLLSKLVKPVKGKETKILYTFIILIVAAISYSSVIRNNVWQDSGTLWHDSLSKNAQNFIALNNLGTWYYGNGENEKAKNFLLTASYMSPSETHSLKNLGEIYMKEDLDKAELIYKKLLELEPKSIIFHRRMWEILEKQGRINEAGGHMDFVLSAPLSDVVALNQKGLILYRSKNYKQGEDTFRKAIDNFPDNPDLYFNLGMLLQDTLRLDEAFDSFAKAADIKRDFALAYDRMGQVLYLKKDYGGAIKMYDKALELHSGLPEIYTDMGNVFFARGEYGRADEFYTKSLALNSNVFEPFFNSCVIMEKTGATEDAVECYLSCADKFKNRPEMMNNIGSIMFRKGRLKEAESYFLKALEIDNFFSDAHYNLVLLYLKLNEPEKTLKHYDKSKKKFIDDFNTLHKICAKLGDSQNLEEAVECYKQLLVERPESAIDNFQLGIILLRKNLKKEAEPYFKKALELDPENKYFQQFIYIE
jgi:protein O-mannosyl-transferase